jgi:hypothetical protein
MRKPRRGITRQDTSHSVQLHERKKIGITALKGINILFDDDIYELAYWLLKMNDAKNRGTNTRSRHTVYGVAGIYAMQVRLDRDDIVHLLESHGLPSGATIEYDDDV